MLTTLSTLKSRLAIPSADSTYDSLLTSAILALSARVDKLTNRTLARTENATFEFHPADTELCPPCYPIESVAKFQSKTSESAGWQDLTPAPDYLLRSACIISLATPLNYLPSTLSSSPPLARVTYTGGYLLPGMPPPDPPVPACQSLPPDLEHAAVEQLAFWFQNRDHLGLKTYWPSGLAYLQFATFDLLPAVQSTLKTHTRHSL